MKNFEERLEKLELLGEKIKDNSISLDEALKAFEEGIKLAKGLEQDLDNVESRIEKLMNSAELGTEGKPELSLFDSEA